MADEHSHKPLPTTHRPEPTDLSNIAPARSRTEPPLLKNTQQKEKSNLHRRLHSNSLRHRPFAGKEHGYRHAAKETVQSAIDLKPPISFDRLLRRHQEAGDHNRKNNLHPQQQPQQQPQHDELDSSTQLQEQPTVVERPRAKPQDIAKLKRQNAQREEELLRSLKDVEEAAMKNTRQLDDTYYNILEKASMLHNVVTNLQQLTEESRKLHANFREDTKKLESETSSNLNGFGNFDAQEKIMDGLVGKLKASKAQTDALNERLEAARTRVAKYEQRENARQRTRQKRLQMSWVIMFGLTAFVLALIIAKRRAVIGSRLHTAVKVFDEFGHELAAPVTAILKPATSPSEDKYLDKLFDGL